MEIEFVNHASFIIESGNVRLICDPWFEGTAFDNGWSLISETKHKFSSFENITHIWFSHEHPDHFSPPNLFKIPLEIRKTITVLFQETVDKKVVEFCEKLEFKSQIELKENQFHEIEEGFELLCNPYTGGDSWVLFKIKNQKLLNLNDCIVNSEKRAQELLAITGEVDVLFTQFGYANKIGNSDEAHKRIEASSEKLKRIGYQVKSLKPKVVVPFASFVFFCHEENNYMNEGMNKVQVIYDYITTQLKRDCYVLYPADLWKYGDSWNSSAALESYAKDYNKIGNRRLIQSSKVEAELLISESKIFVNKLVSAVSSNVDVFYNWKSSVYVYDLDKSYDLTGANGLKERHIDKDSCDISIGSQALFYVFKHLWGGDTLNVNARFQEPINGEYYKFQKFSSIAAKMNRGETHDFPAPISLLSRLKLKLQMMLGK
jgi:UDP-MurNAc hydroxylase